MGEAQEAPDNLPDVPVLINFPNVAHVEFVMSSCQECPEKGPWTLTIRDGNGRCTQYDMWDVHHSDQTGHKRFHQFKLTRSNSRIM